MTYAAKKLEVFVRLSRAAATTLKGILTRDLFGRWEGSGAIEFQEQQSDFNHPYSSV